jgi:pimeloyl-[acyl-carrier protein] methyl ester esterase
MSELALHSEWDEGSGSALLCLHGWGMNLRVFDALRAALRPDFRTGAVDLPGHGRSGWSAAAADFQAQSSLLKEALPNTGVLVGWSLGAQFALELARKFPERVRALILIAATPRFEHSADWALGLDQQAVGTFREILTQDWRQMLEDFVWLQLRGSRHAEEAQQVISAALAAHGTPNPEALRADLDLLATRDARDLLPQISQPTLVVAGQHDRITPPAASEWLARHLPRAQFAVVQRAGHAPFVSHVDETALLIRKFLSTLQLARAL